MVPAHTRGARPRPWVTVIVLSVITIDFDTVRDIAIGGAAAGVLGIAVGGYAIRRAAKAVRQCRDLIDGAVGSRGTVDPRAVRDVAIVRYDALNEMSGHLSFSVALLNSVGDGVVVTSINGRGSTRTYAKPVVAGKGEQELSPEEMQAVHEARLGTGQLSSESVTPRAQARTPLLPRPAAGRA